MSLVYVDAHSRGRGAENIVTAAVCIAVQSHQHLQATPLRVRLIRGRVRRAALRAKIIDRFSRNRCMLHLDRDLLCHFSWPSPSRLTTAI